MLVTSLTHLKNLVHDARAEIVLSVDVETTGLDVFKDSIVGIAFAGEKWEWYMPVTADTLPEVMRVITPLLDLTKHRLISHNTPFDMHFLYRAYTEAWGEEPPWFQTSLHWWDTMTMASLVDENLLGVTFDLPEMDGTIRKVGALGLKALSSVYLGRHQRLWDASYKDWTPEEQASYASADVRNTYDLALLFSRYLTKEDLWEYYQKRMAPLSFTTLRMEQLGIMVDVPKILEVKAQVQKDLDALYEQARAVMPVIETRVYSADLYPGTKKELQTYLWQLVQTMKSADMTILDEWFTAKGNVKTAAAVLAKLHELRPDDPILSGLYSIKYTAANPNSNAQMADYLVAKGYRLPLTPSGQPSVAEEVLLEVQKEHPEDPIWGPLLQMRHLEKLMGTYLDGILKYVGQDGRVRPKWNGAATPTSRYTTSVEADVCRGPALQTIPRPDTVAEQGWPYNPREWFVAAPGHVLVVADAKQLEVRMLAMMSQDKDLMAVVNAGGDIHLENAKKVVAVRDGPDAWATAEPAQQKKWRTDVKALTFGVAYGIGGNKLSDKQNIPLDEANDLIAAFYETYPGVDRYKRQEFRLLAKQGYVTSMLGRRRSPVLIQRPPRVSAKPHTTEWEMQKLQERLWQAEWEYAARKSGFDLDNVDDRALEGRAERQAFNFEIQGSAAEFINYGLWQLVRMGYNVVAQIHDEVILEVEDTPEAISQAEADICRLYNVEIRGVKFEMDVHHGATWACGK